MPVKILLADKSITIQKVVEMLFSGRDYEVVCASDGETALSEATRVVPDIVLADVDLPRIGGYALAVRMKQTPQLANIPVILMMSRDDVFDNAKGKEAGLVDSIAKPFESQELIGKVKKAVAAAPSRPPTPAQPIAAAVPPQPAPAPRPAVTAAPAKPKKAAPADIFDIISEAPTQADLMREAAPVEEEAVYEVEPVVEEVETPLERVDAKALPIGAKAMEEMRAGLGLTEPPEEPQPEIVTFESFEQTMKAKPRAEFKPEPSGQQPAAVSRPAQTAKTPSEKMPLSQPTMLTASDVWSIAEEAVAKMAKEAFPKSGPAPALPESELRRMAEETLSRTARDMFKDIQPPIPKISEETVRRGISEAVTIIAREIAREVIEKVAWEVIPRLAEVMIQEEIERLKKQP